MAKKEYTPEEQELRTLRKSIRHQTAGQVIAAIVVLAIVAGVFSFLFKKAEPPKASDETTTATQEVQNVNTNANTNTTPAGPSDISKAEAVALLNKATADAASKSYDWKRVCDYTPTGAIDVGSEQAKNAINKVINGISKGSDIDSVMGNFMGVGTMEEKVTNGQCSPKMEDNKAFLLKGMSVTEEDVQNYSVKGDQVEFDLVECVNPTTDGKNAIHHVTDDFITPESMTELVEGNSKGAIKLAETSKSRVHSIHITATITDGTLKDLEFTYKLSAEPAAMKVAFLTVEGKGEIQVTESYKNFA